MQPQTTGRDRPVCREQLAPLLYRRLSLALYRRSARFAHKAATNVGPSLRLRTGLRGSAAPTEVGGSWRVLPAVSELLAVYLSQRLPARVLARLGVRGLLLIARPLAVVAGGGGWICLQTFRAAFALREVFRRTEKRSQQAAAPSGAVSASR